MNKDNNVKKINGEDLIDYYVKLTSNLNYELAIRNISINKLKEVIEEKENEVQELNDIIADKDKEIEKLKKENNKVKGEDKKPLKEKEE